MRFAAFVRNTSQQTPNPLEILLFLFVNIVSPLAISINPSAHYGNERLCTLVNRFADRQLSSRRLVQEQEAYLAHEKKKATSAAGSEDLAAPPAAVAAPPPPMPAVAGLLFHGIQPKPPRAISLLSVALQLRIFLQNLQYIKGIKEEAEKNLGN